LHLDSIGFALSIDHEVAHIPGVVAFWIIESVLLAFGIEMRTGGLEVWRIALGILVEVDGVLAGRQIMKIEFEADARPLLK
jgi:hypothetical protein